MQSTTSQKEPTRADDETALLRKLADTPKHQRLRVIKQNGLDEEVNYDKILKRIRSQCFNLDINFVDASAVAVKVVNGLYNGVSTAEIDNLASEIAASMTTKHSDYATLAARIAVSHLHKRTSSKFSQVTQSLYDYVNPETRKHAPLVALDHCRIVQANAERLDAAIVDKSDFHFNYFGFKTLERYLLKINGQTAERPQHLLMRVAVGIHGDNIDAAIETYQHMSEGWFIHASATLFRAGTTEPQMASCFLLSMKDDSIEGIYDTLKQCALISKSGGGVSVSVHNIRAFGSYVAGTNSTSHGLLPLIRVYNDTARYVTQGGNKRPGAFAMYLEPWHADVFEFLHARKNTGTTEQRARDLFYALWIPALFMKRVHENGAWTLMCPNECPDLADCWGDKFEALYERYEREGRGRRQVPARELWTTIMESQIETGTPYMLYKDSCNRKSNQQNLGTIKSSNLCAEIIEYSSADEVAVCNVASVALNKFVIVNSTTSADGGDGVPSFDFNKLRKVVKILTRNLNALIDRNWYPIAEAERSNKRHRPIAVGVQGLADVFILMRYPFESEEAQKLNVQIFETL